MSAVFGSIKARGKKTNLAKMGFGNRPQEEQPNQNDPMAQQNKYSAECFGCARELKRFSQNSFGCDSRRRKKRLLLRSSKTVRHFGKESRVIPLFPEMRGELKKQ